MYRKIASQSGVALVIVLGFLVIISALIVAFFSSVTTELKGARTFASGVTTRQLADSAANLVMGQIRLATTSEDAAWASQPGMIRVYRKATKDTAGNVISSTPSSDAEAFIKLYSSDELIVPEERLTDFIKKPDYEKNWNSSPALWTDLNSPVIVPDPAISALKVTHFPVIDPRATPRLAAPKEFVQGFSYDASKVDQALSAGTDDDRLPMPVKWIYMLQDGTMTTPDSGSGTTAKWTSGNLKKPTKVNPIVGRIAFWTDDDTSKVNINTAAGFVNTPTNLPAGYTDYTSYAGSYWDTPRFYTNFDYGIPDSVGKPVANQPSGGLALTQLLQGEYQRYPGHPATTSLGGIFGSYLTSEDLWRILPRISTSNYMNTSALNSVATTIVDKLSYGTNGGTKRIMVGPPPAGGGTDNQNLLPRTERLYASVDELLFATNRAGPLDPTDPTYQRQSTDAYLQAQSPKLTPERLDKLRFFLTATSRAPELNLFGRPRVTIWPVRSERNDETTIPTTLTTTQVPNIKANAPPGTSNGTIDVRYFTNTAVGTNPINNSADNTVAGVGAGTGLNPYDKVMLFCSTIGAVNSTTAHIRNSEYFGFSNEFAPGTATLPLPYRYIFFRRNPHLVDNLSAVVNSTSTQGPNAVQEDQYADITLPRNRYLLETYLSRLTSQNIPGFADPTKNYKNLKDKWDAPTALDVVPKPNRDGILVEIFDYCRTANMQDGTFLEFSTDYTKPQLNKVNRYFSRRGLMGPSRIEFKEPTPSVPGVPTQMRSAGLISRGMGRFPTLSEASLVFYYAGPTWKMQPPPIPTNGTGTPLTLRPEKFSHKNPAPAGEGTYNSTYVGQPRYRQMRAFLALSTFNPMFGYAPQYTATSTEPRISFEITGLKTLSVSWTGNGPGAPGQGATELGFTDKDPEGNNNSTTMYVPSGGTWTGRNMGGYEGFMHVFTGGNFYDTSKPGDVFKHKIRERVYREIPTLDIFVPLAPQFFGATPPGGGPANNVVGDANQEHYPFQTTLVPNEGDPITNVPYDAATKDLVPYRSPIVIPTPVTLFKFHGGEAVVKVWYDTYTPKTRPTQLGGKNYLPVQTITLKFPEGNDWPVPKGDEQDSGVTFDPGGSNPPAPPTNPSAAALGTVAATVDTADARANFDPKINKKLQFTNNWNSPTGYYWNHTGSFAPEALNYGMQGYPPPISESGVTWRSEFYAPPPAPLHTLPYKDIPSGKYLKCALEPAWSLASRINWSTKNSWSPDRASGQSGGKAAPYNWYAERWRNIVQPGDTVKSLVFCHTPDELGGSFVSTGDMRIASLMEANTKWMEPHPDYKSPAQRACGLRTASGAVYFGDSQFGSLLYPGDGKAPMSTARAPANLPFSGPPNNRGMRGGIKGVVRADTPNGLPQNGDFDTGMGNFADGPYANKPDEGNVIYAWWNDIERRYEYPIPYFESTWVYERPGNTFTSPLRQLPSPGMFGSLPARPASGNHWETLCFTPYPAGQFHPGNEEPKDHLLLDLFNMPIVEPYPISEPFSTAGKINLNYRIAPFDYITRSTALRAAFAPIRVTGVDNTDYNVYKTGSPAGTRLSTNYRKILDANDVYGGTSRTLKAFEDFFDEGKTSPNKGMFKSASQICEMPLYPVGATVLDGPSGFWTTRALTGDNVREKPYVDLYPRLTTKSNTYTVHYRVQTLRQIPRNATNNPEAYAVWEEGKDSMLGEARGATTIERYIDPADRRFNQFEAATINAKDFINPDATKYNPADTTNGTGLNATRSLEYVYRFRTVMNKKFAP